MNVNKKGTIYYGTDIKYLEELDEFGMNRPRIREEQFISVSISGYESPIEIGHADLQEFGRVFSEELNICTIKNNRFIYNDGYNNTLTYVGGFGPNPSKYIHSFYGLVENRRTSETMTVVLNNKAKLVIPDEEREFEYMSLALHGFIEQLTPEMIAGWIVPSGHYEHVLEMMQMGKIRNLPIWKDTEFKPMDHEALNNVKCGLFPKDIEMYVKNIRENNFYATVRFDHLKAILTDFNNINWECGIDGIEEELKSWLELNQSRIQWDGVQSKYVRLAQ